MNQTDQLNLRDYWRVIVKHRRLITIIFLIVVTAVAIYSLTMIPVYRATTQILIERANPNVLSMEEMLAINPQGQDFYQTQYKIIESRALAWDVITRLNLAAHPAFKAPETEPGVFSYIKELKDAMKGGIKDLLSLVRPTRPDVKEDQYGGAMALSPDMASTEDLALIEAFLGNLEVEPIRNSRLVNISFDSTYPELSARVVNTLVKAYIDWNLGLRLKSQQAASSFLDDQVKAAKLKLAAAELALQQYREKYGVAIIASQSGKDSEYGQNLSRQKLLTISKQLLEAKNKRIEAEIKYKNALNLSKNPLTAETIPEVITSPVITSMKEHEVELLREKSEKSQKFGPRHPMMVALNDEIEKLKTQRYQEIKNIVSSLKASYEIALNQERSLQEALGVSQDETISRDKIAIQYQVLQQEADSSRQLYDMLLKRFKEANVFEENRTINIHVIDAAVVPEFPVKPKLKLNLLLALIVGLFMGGGAAFLIEYLDNTIKNPEDLERYFQLPYLGPVPHFDMKNPDTAQPELIVANDPKASASEAYRGIRTGILFSTPDQSPVTILVTSAGAGEGKTMTCANLAIAMAQAGTKVVIIDCDMRKPRLHRTLGIKKEQGLSSILVGESQWRDMMVPTNIPNLDFIPAGPISPNPAELVGSERMRTLIKELSEEYSRVIIDSSPITAVTDPVILSRIVDGVVLVIRAGETSRDVIANAIRQLNDVQAHILGSVLNNVDIGKDGYYYYQYNYYYYGEEGDTKKKRRSKKR
jgi:capsular exopolysaccharide synthesis family protein